MPLSIVSLSYTRCADGSFCDWAGHAGARAAVAALFDARFQSVDALSDDDLVNVDLVVVHTTSARVALSAQEQQSLRHFCELGGTALLNCFSNWTDNGGYGSEVVNFLGLRPEPRSAFNRTRISKMCTHAACADLSLSGPWFAHALYPRWKDVCNARDRASQGSSAALEMDEDDSDEDDEDDGLELSHAAIGRLAEGPHLLPTFAESNAGDVDFYISAADDMLSREPCGEFSNTGETFFDATHPLSNGSAVRLCEPRASESNQRCLGPLWFNSAHGLGQALVCSNMHWIADRAAWDGGLVDISGNTTLWLNLCAAACRAL